MSGSGDMLADRETQTRTPQLLRSPYRWGGGTYTSLHALHSLDQNTRFITDDQMLSVIFTPKRQSQKTYPSHSHFPPLLFFHTTPPFPSNFLLHIFFTGRDGVSVAARYNTVGYERLFFGALES